MFKLHGARENTRTPELRGEPTGSVGGAGSVREPRCCGRGSCQGFSECWKTGSGKGEGVPVRGVKLCKVLDMAR